MTTLQHFSLIGDCGKGLGMRKTKLPIREVEICQRLRAAREELGRTHQECAMRIGIPRTTLLNYEMEKTPVRFELALRFCRQFVISEEWLATGRHEATEASALKHGQPKGTDLHSLHTVFFRQCMDLLSEPICRQIPPGTLWGAAYDAYLAPLYAKLVQQFFFFPRIIVTDEDMPELGIEFLNAVLERYLKMLSNEALRLKAEPKSVQRSFIRALLESNDIIFKRFIGLPTPKIPKFLREIVLSPDRPIGALLVLSAPEMRLPGKEVETAMR
jgi:DNA-binding XRE family transcriptional regulator